MASTGDNGTVPPAEDSLSSKDLEVADELSAELVRFARLVNRAKSEFSKRDPDGIERAAYAILACLVHDGPQRTGKLAESLHAEISTISRQSSSLVQHGLIERLVDPEDGRASQLAPTAEGLRVFEENRCLRNRWLAELLGDWPETDSQQLARLLDRFNSAIEEHVPQLTDGGSTPQPRGKE